MQENKIEKMNKIKQIFQFAKNDAKRQQAKREKLVKKIELLKEKCQKTQDKKDIALDKHGDYYKRLDDLLFGDGHDEASGLFAGTCLLTFFSSIFAYFNCSFLFPLHSFKAIL